VVVLYSYTDSKPHLDNSKSAIRTAVRAPTNIPQGGLGTVEATQWRRFFLAKLDTFRDFARVLVGMSHLVPQNAAATAYCGLSD
jgi:hypothetical protein